MSYAKYNSSLQIKGPIKVDATLVRSTSDILEMLKRPNAIVYNNMLF